MPTIDPITGQVIPDPFGSSNNTVPIPLPQLGGAAPPNMPGAPPALPSQFAVPPATPAQQAYQDWTKAMPQRPKSSVLSTLLAAALGGAAGFTNVKAGYPGGVKQPLNAQPAVDALTGKTGYNQSLQDWSNKGAGLKESAAEEQQRIKDQLGLTEAQARIEASKAAREASTANKQYLADLSADRLDETKKKNQETAQNNFIGRGGEALNNETDTLPSAPAPEGLPQLPAQQATVAPPTPTGMVPAAVSPDLFGPGVSTFSKAPKADSGNTITPEMFTALQAMGKTMPGSPDLPGLLGVAQGDKVNDKTYAEIQKAVRQGVKPPPSATTGAAQKAQAAGVLDKLAGANIMQPGDANDFGRLGAALKQGLKTGAITQDEYNKVVSYTSLNSTPGATNAAGMARAGAFATARAQNTATNVLDKVTGEISDVPLSAVVANPGRFTGAAGVDKWLNRNAMINTMKVNIGNVRGALQSAPDLDSTTRAQIAAAMAAGANAGPGEAGAVHAAWNALIQNSTMSGMDPQTQNLIASMQTLSEDAMGLRQLLGSGQGSESVRKAILSTIPGAGTPKDFSLKQLDNLGNMIDSLGAPAQKAMATPSLNNGMPQRPGALPPGAAPKPYTQADVNAAVAHGYGTAAQIEQAFKAAGRQKQ